MKFKLPPFRSSGQALAAGAAAGIAAVLLAMLTIQRPPGTVLLGFMAPLPLMIATMAYGPLAGALAVVVGTIFVAVFDMKFGHLVLAENPSDAPSLLDSIVFFVGLGLPSWVLSILARHPVPPPRAGAKPPLMRPDEQRLSRVAMAAAAFSIVTVAFLATIAAAPYGSFANLAATLATGYEELQKASPSAATLNEAERHRIAVLVVAFVPWLVAGIGVIFYLANLWITARIARAAGSFAEDWPDIPRNMRLPRLAAVVLAISLGTSFAHDLPGLVSHIVSGALVAAFSIQGLAVVHDLTRGKTWRAAALVFTYGLVPFVCWALLGVLDTAFSFRDRRGPVVRRPTERKSPWK